MRGVGGPLLCIGDLLSDVGESDDGAEDYLRLKIDSAPPSPAPSPSTLPSSSSLPNLNLNLQPSDLTKLFQEKYDHLNKALAGTDHSWTILTLELCTALETASKLVHSTNSHAELLLEKIGELERVVKRGDTAIIAAKAIYNSLNPRVGPVSNQNIEQPHL